MLTTMKAAAVYMNSLLLKFETSKIKETNKAVDPKKAADIHMSQTSSCSIMTNAVISPQQSFCLLMRHTVPNAFQEAGLVKLHYPTVKRRDGWPQTAPTEPNHGT